MTFYKKPVRKNTPQRYPTWRALLNVNKSDLRLAGLGLLLASTGCGSTINETEKEPVAVVTDNKTAEGDQRLKKNRQKNQTETNMDAGVDS